MIKEQIISEDFVKNAIIKWLSSNGWGHLEYGPLHTHGVDIKARNFKYSRYFYIETKGEGKIRQTNEVSFVYSLGQIITRMKFGGSTRNYFAIALPENSAKIALRRLPWQVARKLLLFLFSVNHNGEVLKYSWQDLKELQVAKSATVS